MAAVDSPIAATSQKSAKKKKKSKKKTNGKPEEGGQLPETNGVDDNELGDADDDEVDEDGGGPGLTNSTGTNHSGNDVATGLHLDTPQNSKTSSQQDIIGPGHDRDRNQEDSADKDLETTARLDSLQQERDQLRAEVSQLRRQLESLQEAGATDNTATSLREELEQTKQGKEHAEAQYRSLLGKVNTIRSQLGERLKADAEELGQARSRIEELETERSKFEEENVNLRTAAAELNKRIDSQASEIATLRDRTNLSASNWSKERDELINREATLREQYEDARQAMQDWQILAIEERSRKEALEERSQELEEQLDGQRAAHEQMRTEIDMQNSTVDGLQRAIRDLQEERKRELREMVEQSQAQLVELRKQSKAAEDAAAEWKQQLEATQKELERALPYEKEVREKNLLIGKLRHEAVILNDHLTKALRFLKRGKPEDNVDRQLVTNHLIHFLALERSDPKKFQVLQLIAALLGWNEEQREQAGLLRQGSITGSSSLKLPMSPFRRTPSTPSLSTDFMPDSAGSASKESLAELWSEFLEREAETGSKSRAGSVTTTLRSPSLASVASPLGNKAEWGAPLELEAPRRKESAGVGSAKKP